MFDPYHKWLGIPKEQQPPDYYQLLGVSRNEQDPEVIEEAALMRIAHLRSYQLGPHTAECTRLLRELGAASEALCDPGKRAAYDKSAPSGQSEPDSNKKIEVVSRANVHNKTTPPPVSSRISAPPLKLPPPPSTVPPATHPMSRESMAPTFASPPPLQSYPPATLGDSHERPEDEFLQELSDKALRDLREPVKPEDESLLRLTQQMFREWMEQLPPWWPTFVRRLRTVLMLVVLSGGIFYLVNWLRMVW